MSPLDTHSLPGFPITLDTKERLAAVTASPDAESAAVVQAFEALAATAKPEPADPAEDWSPVEPAGNAHDLVNTLERRQHLAEQVLITTMLRLLRPHVTDEQFEAVSTLRQHVALRRPTEACLHIWRHEHQFSREDVAAAIGTLPEWFPSMRAFDGAPQWGKWREALKTTQYIERELGRERGMGAVRFKARLRAEMPRTSEQPLVCV